MLTDHYYQFILKFSGTQSPAVIQSNLLYATTLNAKTEWSLMGGVISKNQTTGRLFEKRSRRIYFKEDNTTVIYCMQCVSHDMTSSMLSLKFFVHSTYM